MAQVSGMAPPLSFFPVRQLWQVSLAAPPSARGVFADEAHAFVPLSTGSLAAVSMQSAQLAWTARADVLGVLAAEPGRIIVATEGAVLALDPTTGDRIWTLPDDGGSVVAASFSGPRLVLVAETGVVRSLAASTGALEWRHELGAAAGSSLAVTAADALVGLAGGRVAAVRLQDGMPRWTTLVDGQPGALAVRNDRVYFGTADRAFYSIRITDGRIDWRWRVGAVVVGGATFDDRHVYFAALDNQIRALDLDNGAQRWRKPLPGRPVGSPVVTGATVIVPCLAAEIRGFAGRDGASQGRYPTDAELATPLQVLRRPLTAGGDIVLLVLSDGTLLAAQRRVEPPLVPLNDLPGVTVPITPAPAVAAK
ncbi:MAG: PQQ-binding-like beta-propeller repeat protein [Vicinamibacterales bacterium]